MLGLLQLPIVLLRVAFFSVKGFLDALAGRNRLRSEFTVSIDAPREKVWQFVTDDHMVLDGPPAIETFSELLPDNLRLTRIFVNGQQQSQNVSRDIERDDDKGVFRARLIDHPLSKPPEDGRDVESGIIVASTPAGTTLTLYNELTVRYFHDRINMRSPRARRLIRSSTSAKKRQALSASRRCLPTRDGCCLSRPS
jgi:hypothetical protein